MVRFKSCLTLLSEAPERAEWQFHCRNPGAWAGDVVVVGTNPVRLLTFTGTDWIVDEFGPIGAARALTEGTLS